MRYLLIVSLFLGLSVGCTTDKSGGPSEKSPNPAADGFNFAGSDQVAVEIADRVMKAMGGRKSWDHTRFLTWNFFGRRTLWWDKLLGDVRIKMHSGDSTQILINIFDGRGKVMKNGEELTNPDSVAFYLDRGKSIWINDSYWLFMPFKLKDSGVTLKYVGEDTTQTGSKSDVLELTFENVGKTPQNKYHVWIDRSDDLVKQWAYYRENVLDTPNFITPWVGYQKYGEILLAGNRGDRDITEIAVLENMDKTFFEKF